MMWKVLLVFMYVCVLPAYADENELNAAISNVVNSCSGISDEMSDIKKMAGISTAISGVGAAAGLGGGIAGVAKAQQDKVSAELEEMLAKLDEVSAPESNEIYQVPENLESMLAEYKKGATVDAYKNIAQAALDESEKKSKTLGNVRTGLLATNTVANIAGAAVSSKADIKQDLSDRVKACINAVSALDDAVMQAHVSGVPDDSSVVSRAKLISGACGKYDINAFEKIHSQSRAATIANAVGAVTGGAGTVTSAMANNAEKKQYELNTASNVLAFGASASSIVGTAFSGAQVSAAKKIISIATDCEEALR